MTSVWRSSGKVNHSRQGVAKQSPWVQKVMNLIYWSCCQTTTRKVIEAFLCVVVAVIFRACRSVKLLYLLVLTGYTSPINQIVNPKPVLVTNTWQYVHSLRHCLVALYRASWCTGNILENLGRENNYPA
jgi:hypothetical protein